ncbi:hypothetical protein GWK48_06115 [Metallosphaera tengchongensis]|uniref:Uncharacterized protein n=1 Tax=Metallosphaera tengchongensis TaxID=1532350 RepID=A0A6N0NXA7_9CREN|nr:DUF5752 family protein [Metallosphaera tengchongensis]QKR00008.1 hypothetical protein GWK48_06115 [Metallosphaera tengchongensis]
MTKEFLDAKARQPFEFYAAYYPPIYAGKKALTIEDLIDGLRKVDGFSVFYHVFHPVFSSHVIPYDLHNDFAFWIRDELHDPSLAYRVSDVEAVEPKTVEQVREDIINILEESDNKNKGKPFHFNTCRPVVFDTGIRAHSIGELIDILSNITMRSIVYHLVFRRVMGYAETNDFSAWLIREFQADKVAQSISMLDPQTYNSEEKLRSDILSTLEKVIFS